MIFAILQPAALLGLLAGFFASLYVRVAAQRYFGARIVDHRRISVRTLRFHWRQDIDAFGAIAAALGGLGWGKASHLSYEVSARSSYGYGGGATTLRSHRRALALAIASGPLAVLVASQLVFAVNRLVYGDAFSMFSVYRASEILRGAEDTHRGEQILVSAAVSMLCFGLLAFVPLPPLDGFGLMWLSLNRPSDGLLRARHLLVDQNIGAVILVVLSLPLGLRGAILPAILDVVATPLMRLWA